MVCIKYFCPIQTRMFFVYSIHWNHQRGRSEKGKIRTGGPFPQMVTSTPSGISPSIQPWILLLLLLLHRPNLWRKWSMVYVLHHLVDWPMHHWVFFTGIVSLHRYRWNGWHGWDGWMDGCQWFCVSSDIVHGDGPSDSTKAKLLLAKD